MMSNTLFLFFTIVRTHVLAIFFACVSILTTCALPHTSFAEDANHIYRGVAYHGAIDDAAADQLIKWKVNLVRYTLVWGDPKAVDSSNEATYLAWLQDALNEFDFTLNKLKARNIKVALNIHAAPGGFTTRGSRATHRLFTNTIYQDTLVKAWQIIAKRYAGHPNIWAFDLLNEPAQPKVIAPGIPNWNELAQRVAEAVRVIDPKTPVIMTPVYGKLTRLKGMKPLTVPNVFYTIHFYDPWRFIHQGVLGVPRGITYPSKLGNVQKFQRSFRPLQAFAKKNNARIFIGEFSVARWAPNGSGARYLNDVTRLFNRLGFDWTYHSYRGATVWDLEGGDKKSITLSSPSSPSSRLKVMLKAWSKNS